MPAVSDCAKYRAESASDWASTVQSLSGAPVMRSQTIPAMALFTYGAPVEKTRSKGSRIWLLNMSL